MWWHVLGSAALATSRAKVLVGGLFNAEVIRIVDSTESHAEVKESSSLLSDTFKILSILLPYRQNCRKVAHVIRRGTWGKDFAYVMPSRTAEVPAD